MKLKNVDIERIKIGDDFVNFSNEVPLNLFDLGILFDQNISFNIYLFIY